MASLHSLSDRSDCSHEKGLADLLGAASHGDSEGQNILVCEHRRVPMDAERFLKSAVQGR